MFSLTVDELDGFRQNRHLPFLLLPMSLMWPYVTPQPMKKVFFSFPVSAGQSTPDFGVGAIMNLFTETRSCRLVMGEGFLESIG